jgi:hypothetical protein
MATTPASFTPTLALGESTAPEIRNGHPVPLRVKPSRDGASFTLKGPLVKQAAVPDHRREFVDRLFSLPNVSSIALEPYRGQVKLYLDKPVSKAGDFVSALGVAMQSPRASSLRLNHEDWLVHPPIRGFIEVYRVEGELSFWDITEIEQDTYRLFHPLLNRNPALQKNVRFALGTLPGVFVHPPRTWSGGRIEVSVRGVEIDAAALLDVIDPALDSEDEAEQRKHHPTSVHRVLHHNHDGLVNANLVIAPITEFLFPPLGIANLILVWMINRVHLAPAWDDLKKGKTNLHLLYFSIGALTLISYSFFAAAIMYWLMSFWRRRTRQLREQCESDFLARFERFPRRVWVESGSVTVQTRLADVPKEAIVLLKAGDYVPADGTIISGNATVDERWLTGQGSPSGKGAGATIYRSSEIIEGSLRMKLSDRTAHSSALVAEWYRDQWSRRGWEMPSQSQEFATKAVLPTLLIGLIGLTRGGISEAKAVMRPDFYSGPESATELLDLATSFNAADEGLLISGAATLEPLLDVDILIIDDSVGWFFETNQSDAKRFVTQIKAFGINEVIFLGDRSDLLGLELGCDLVQARMDPEAKRGFIEHRRSFSDRVAYIGDCVTQAPAANEADFAMSVLTPPFIQPILPHPALLSADLCRVLRAFEWAEQSRSMFTSSTRIALVPNLAAMFAGLYLGTHLGTSVAITNAGTMINYVRGAAVLEMSR